MKHLLLVGLGGFCGSVLRYGVGLWVATWKLQFPLATLLVNLLGCFCIGILGALIEKKLGISQELRLLLITGFLGGFTTFSAFGLDALSLLREGKIAPALLYIGLNVFGGLLLVWLGFVLVRPKVL